MTHEPDQPNSVLLAELRADDANMDELALARLQRRLDASTGSDSGTDVASYRPPRRTRWWRGAHAGLAAALLVGSALGAGGHALVSYTLTHHSHSPENAGAAPSAGLSGAAASSRLEPAALAPAVLELDAPKAAPALSPQPVLPRHVATASADERTGLEAELRELEAARRALVEGRAAQALDALRQHRQRYPQSMLQQERDAMTVKALVASGRHSEARSAAAAFERSYPSSLLLDSVKHATTSIP